MSTVICPMLAALHPIDANGQAVNRECIRGDCRFYNLEQQDCNLSLGTRAVAILAEAAMARPEAADHQAMLAGAVQPIADRLAGLEERIGQVGAEIERFDPRIASLLELEQASEQRLAAGFSRLGASIDAVGQAAKAAGQPLQAVGSAVTAVESRVARLEETLRGVDARLAKMEQGSRTVVEALEAQVKRDRDDLEKRRQDEAVACNNRGVGLYYRGAFEAAKESFDRALQMQPDYAEALNNLGLTLSKLGREKEAVEAFRRALTVDPKMGEAYNNLGFLYHASSQLDRAAQMFGMAAESSSDSSVAYTNLGNTFYAMQQPEKAVEAWRRAVDLDPLNENARRGLRMFAQEASGN
jgi:tetratricopeptide (TPR) repeat protein